MTRHFPFFALVLFVAACASPAARPPGSVSAGEVRPVERDRLMEDLAFLADDALEGRRAGTPGNAQARAYLVDALRSTGIEPVGDGYLQPFSFVGRRDSVRYEGVNVVGRVEGTEEPDQVIVVTAHYDHLGVRDGQIYNGADDNASGTAALLEMARHVVDNPLRHTVIFAALDAEEMGLQGARAFVAGPPVPLDQVVLNINMDMVSRSTAGELYAAGTYHYPFLRPLLEPVAARAPVTLLFGHDRPDLPEGDDWTMASDHGPFHEKGIPFVYFGVEDHAGYHQPSDDVSDVTPAFYADAVATILDALRTLDTALTGEKDEVRGAN